MADLTKTRGYRNKNPGNIDYNERNKWQGQVGKEPGPGGRFAVFSSHEYGIRAIAMLLATYQDRYGLRTVRAVITKWAPDVENDTDSYIAAVARRIGVGPDEELDLHTYAHLRPLVEAIIRHELGGVPYSAATIDDGLRLAGVPKPITTIAQAAHTETGRGAIQAAAATGAVAIAVQAAPVLDGLKNLDWRVGVAFVVAVAVGAVLIVLSRRRRA